MEDLAMEIAWNLHSIQWWMNPPLFTHRSSFIHRLLIWATQEIEQGWFLNRQRFHDTTELRGVGCHWRNRQSSAWTLVLGPWLLGGRQEGNCQITAVEKHLKNSITKRIWTKGTFSIACIIYHNLGLGQSICRKWWRTYFFQGGANYWSIFVCYPIMKM